MSLISEIPNTNWTERLFNTYFLQSFRLGSITFLSPNTQKEFHNTYPRTSIAGAQEVLLQFPHVLYNGKRFIMEVTKETHKKFKGRPPGTTFYVGHTFSSAVDLTQAQLKIKTAKEFLRYFVVVEASSLPETTVKIKYGKSKISGMPIAPICKYERQLKTKVGEKSVTVDMDSHYSGMHFRDLFAKKKLGADFADIYDQHNLQVMNPFVAEKPTLFDEMQKSVDSIGIFRLT